MAYIRFECQRQAGDLWPIYSPVKDIFEKKKQIDLY